jgi:hypothetical protein
MSWRKSDPFILPPEEKKRERKLVGLEKIETDILETEIIAGGALIINNNDMMITSNEMRIDTPNNKMVIPTKGPIRVSSLSYEYSKINMDNVCLVEIDMNKYGNTQHFIFEGREKIDPNLIITIGPYENVDEYSHLMKIHFYSDINPDIFVPFQVDILNQDLSIKLNSVHSSFSLIWLPSKRWNIGELGFKTIVLD